MLTLEQLMERAGELEQLLAPEIAGIRHVQRSNFKRILDAVHEVHLSTSDLRPASGYGIGDTLRDKTEKVFALLYGAEAALVRPQIISGTHALAIALFGILRPRDLLCCVTGAPYDTMEEMIGIRPSPGSLAEFGIRYAQCDLTSNPESHWRDTLARCFGDTLPRVVLIQRSRGYKRVRSIGEPEIAHMIACVRSVAPACKVVVDNCYGDLLETREPTMDGADLVASSFMKNIGAGIAPTGGYVVGTREAVSLAATRYSSPGVGAEIGPNLGFAETFLRGLLFAPLVLEQVLIGNLLASALLEEHGFAVDPHAGEQRGDIVLRVECGSEDRFMAFARAVQESSILDADAVPEPGPMQGYDTDIVMAGGTLVQGSTVELSFDGPFCEPYVGYLQGGLNAWQVVLAVGRAIVACQDLPA